MICPDYTDHDSLHKSDFSQLPKALKAQMKLLSFESETTFDRENNMIYRTLA